MDAWDDRKDNAAALRIRGPAALAASLPYLTECPPGGCIVVAVLGPGGMLERTARCLLPEYPGGASPEVGRAWADDVARTARQGLQVPDLRADERVALVVYLPDEVGRLPEDLAGRLFPRPGELPPQLLDALAVFDGRWRSLVCADDRCCPQQGLRILDNPDAVDAAAALIDCGISGQPLARPAPLAMPQGEAIRACLSEMPYPATFEARREVLEQVWPLAVDPVRHWSAEQVATAVMAADRPGVRDALLVRMARRGRGAADRQWWQQQWRLWTAITAAAPTEWAAGPACLEAVGAWSLGDGADALRAVDAALAADPQHRMAFLLGSLVGRDGSASRWFAGMRRIDEADCLRFDRPPHRRACDGGRTMREAG